MSLLFIAFYAFARISSDTAYVPWEWRPGLHHSFSFLLAGLSTAALILHGTRWRVVTCVACRVVVDGADGGGGGGRVGRCRGRSAF
jgi:hypothetical protein